MSTSKIPKILHYCWFGDRKTSKVHNRCYKSWMEKLKGFDIKKWDESNFDLVSNKYVRQAYKDKNYKKVANYARLYVLYQYGGLYLDTDCLIKKDFSPLLTDNSGFTGFGGDNKELLSAVLCFAPKHPFIKECLKIYDDLEYFDDNGNPDRVTVNLRMTELLEKHGFKKNGQEQTVFGVTVYPMTYFCPLSMLPDEIKDCKSKDTYCITLWPDKAIRRERSFIVRFAHKTGLNKIKRAIIRK